MAFTRLDLTFRTYEDAIELARSASAHPRWVLVGACISAGRAFGHTLLKISEDFGIPYNRAIQWHAAFEVYSKLKKSQREEATLYICAEIRKHPKFDWNNVKGSWDRLHQETEKTKRIMVRVYMLAKTIEEVQGKYLRELSDDTLMRCLTGLPSLAEVLKKEYARRMKKSVRRKSA